MRTQRRQRTPVPVLAGALGGALCWAIGSLALPVGFGTLLLAAGLLLSARLIVAARREPRYREPLPVPVRSRVHRLVTVGVIAALAAVIACNATPYAELDTPVAAMVVGACLVPLAGLVDRRGYLVLGAALMVLGAAGAVLALRSAGGLYPQGVVGLGAGALLWLAVAVETRPRLPGADRIRGVRPGARHRHGTVERS
jgi:hypothetical protein